MAQIRQQEAQGGAGVAGATTLAMAKIRADEAKKAAMMPGGTTPPR